MTRIVLSQVQIHFGSDSWGLGPGARAGPRAPDPDRGRLAVMGSGRGRAGRARGPRPAVTELERLAMNSPSGLGSAVPNSHDGSEG
jgi:hypothetical protein